MVVPLHSMRVSVRSGPVRCQRRADALAQLLGRNGLGKEADDAGLARAQAGGLVGVGGDEHGGDVLARREQRFVQLEPRHPRHAHVRDQACHPRRPLESRKARASAKVAVANPADSSRLLVARRIGSSSSTIATSGLLRTVISE
jgi:hypothetical protein